MDDLEKVIDNTCLACGEAHRAKFFSLFVGGNHYIIGDCSNCNYRIELRADQFGAGIFMPDGTPTTDQFDELHTQHMREHLKQQGNVSAVHETLRHLRMRIVPDRETKKR